MSKFVPPTRLVRRKQISSFDLLDQMPTPIKLKLVEASKAETDLGRELHWALIQLASSVTVYLDDIRFSTMVNNLISAGVITDNEKEQITTLFK